MFWPETKFDISTALLLVRYLVISEMFGSDYVKVGIPEKSTLWYLGIVWSPAPDKEVGTEQIFFFIRWQLFSRIISQELRCLQKRHQKTLTSARRFCFWWLRWSPGLILLLPGLLNPGRSRSTRAQQFARVKEVTNLMGCVMYGLLHQDQCVQLAPIQCSDSEVKNNLEKSNCV